MTRNGKIDNYLDGYMKIKSWPSKEKFQLSVLEYLSTKFQLGVNYTEIEVNNILDQNHTFNDKCLLRRTLIDKGLLDRTSDCKNYWKVGLGLIEGQGETDKLVIRDAGLEESEKLQELYEAGSYLKDIIGDKFESGHIYKCLTEGDLPPIANAKKEYYKLKSIYSKETSKLIGFIEIYHGYPEEKKVWIGFMLIHPDYQNNRFGHEIIEYLCSEAKKIKYEKVGLGVSLKNWLAISFWTKHKFNKIIGVSGDKEFSKENLAFMSLERELE